MHPKPELNFGPGCEQKAGNRPSQIAVKRLPVPDQMNCSDGHIAANLELFQEQWNNYSLATGIMEKGKRVQAVTLVTVMSQECFSLLKNLALSVLEQTDLNKVLDTLAQHFTPTRNTLYEHYVLGSYLQKSAQSMSEYIVEL